jgi:F0F1-type ATP synthase assembly protein I
LTGLISSRYGATIGGLFLALPAIFCASATLIEKHEIRRKRKAGAAGAALGALGMLAFAIVFASMVERSIAVAFIGASLAWVATSGVAWCVRRKLRSVQRRRIPDKIKGSAASRNR